MEQVQDHEVSETCTKLVENEKYNIFLDGIEYLRSKCWNLFKIRIMWSWRLRIRQSGNEHPRSATCGFFFLASWGLVASQEGTGFMALGVHWCGKCFAFLSKVAHKYMELYFNLFVVTCLYFNRPYNVTHTTLLHMHRYHNKFCHKIFMVNTVPTVCSSQISINQCKLWYINSNSIGPQYLLNNTS